MILRHRLQHVSFGGVDMKLQEILKQNQGQVVVEKPIRKKTKKLLEKLHKIHF